jgi:putative membrane protein
MLQWLLAAFHLLALGIGLGAVWVRARSLQGVSDPACLQRALRADNWWGVAALLWVGTGLARLLLGTEKPTAYYLANHLFWLKMTLFLAILALEVGPMISLIRWRIALAKGAAPDLSRSGRWAAFSRVEAALVVAMVFVATAMARGFGMR